MIPHPLVSCSHARGRRVQRCHFQARTSRAAASCGVSEQHPALGAASSGAATGAPPRIQERMNPARPRSHRGGQGFKSPQLHPKSQVKSLLIFPVHCSEDHLLVTRWRDRASPGGKNCNAASPDDTADACRWRISQRSSRQSAVATTGNAAHRPGTLLRAVTEPSRVATANHANIHNPADLPQQPPAAFLPLENNESVSVRC